MRKSDFNFQLPDDLVAQKPLDKRVASRLLCVNRETNSYTNSLFHQLPEWLQPGDLLVLNNTKVIPARIFGTKSTGGKIEVLIERLINDNRAFAHIRASKAPKVGERITLDNNYQCYVENRQRDLYEIVFDQDQKLIAILDEIGHIPLPPYIKRGDTSDDRKRYQTVFATEAGAIAAPTAGLHFDQALLAQIEMLGVEIAYVTLHVGSGTFQPVREENLDEHRMHVEVFEVGDDVVNKINTTIGRVIAVGTTAVRALESSVQKSGLKACRGETDLFITPGYKFQVVDALITNFHLPSSTLLMLTCAFGGYELIMQAYQYAIEQQYRFFSYGDAMFIHS
ncbi:MAG: tRNA preQ1(34) S-adenosylmethionine ribosyltransferase-isomerase QueA [Methylococcaceae bacterium]